MSFPFLRKVFGIGKSVEHKDFDDFLKESPKALSTFSAGRQQVNLVDLAFGSYTLNNKKPLMYSTKVHDLRQSVYLNPSQNIWTRKTTTLPSSAQLLNKNETGCHNGVAICLLLNLELFSTNGVNVVTKSQVSTNSISRRGLSSFSNTESKNGLVPATVDGTFGNGSISSKRFYHMLFEHCLQFSIIVEALHNEVLVVLCTMNRSNLRKYDNLVLGSEIISNAFNSFLDSYRDIYLPKLTFPIWSTLNITLAMTNDFLPFSVNQTHYDYLSSWPNTDANLNLRSSTIDGSSCPYDSLVDVFVRSCLNPLIVNPKSKENRSFLCRMVTGILMFHTGWINSISSSEMCAAFADSKGNNLSTSNAQILTTNLLNQLLTQTGCVANNLEALAGTIFNCTVITSQSRQYLLILLYFASFFLRFTCLTRSRECVPELGQADLFELEQQKQRASMRSKSRRKSGSATSNSTNCCEAHDSGISSQEDLTNMVYSASTGSSPTHVSGMTLCMTRRLTRDQCRIAEAAAHLIVTREAAAAAALTVQQNAGVGLISPYVIGSRCVNPDASNTHVNLSAPSDGSNNSVGAYLSSSPRIGRSQYTEVPLLIEKSFDDEEELCNCLSSEVFPGCSLSYPTHNSNSCSRTKLHCHANEDVSRSCDNFRTASSSTCHTKSSCGCTFNSYLSSVSFSNHCLIGGNVLDSYHSGHVLQATVENFNSFKPRLEHDLIQWLAYGPLVLRGANLSGKSTENDGRSPRSLNRQLKHPRWSATGLLIDGDTRLVEALTLIQPNTSEILMYKESSNFVTTTRSHHTTTVKTQLTNNEQCTSGSILTPMCAFKNSIFKHVVSIKAAPLITRLIDQIHTVLMSTDCSVLTLNYLESNLQLIHQKSIIIKDLLIKEGSGLLQRTDRMISAAGCSHDDLPLLLSIASACSVQAANILHNCNYHWWDV